MDTVARIQLEVAAMKAGTLDHQTIGGPTSAVRHKPVVFTSTKVPRFAGVTSWEQYRQVFDAIAQSNGWDDATAALQLLSHLEGDALNVALLVPEAQRAMRTGLVWELTEHYGSLSLLADYRRQFEKTPRKEGDDQSIFVFLRRHLDSVSPETPIRDIVDRCWVWESHADTEARRFSKPGPERALPIYMVDEPGRGTDVRMVAAVTIPPAAPDQFNVFSPPR